MLKLKKNVRLKTEEIGGNKAKSKIKDHFLLIPQRHQERTML